MGGDYYDRDYTSVPNSTVGVQKTLFKANDPKNYTSGIGITTYVQNPIIIAFDVTGSMGDWSRIFYDKLPMFYGQLMMNSYIQDPGVSICAIGDIEADTAPLQVTCFGQGRQLDSQLSNLWLEGGGGANERQSYDLVAYFYNHFVAHSQNELSFFFVTGDEGYYEHPRTIKPPGETVDTRLQWNRLQQTYNVFHLKKAFEQPDIEQKILQQWISTIGRQRVIQVKDPKACVDIMLGLIAITSGKRTLGSYIADMQARGQSQERIQSVENSLKLYASAIQSKKIVPIIRQSIIEKFKMQFLSDYKKEGREDEEKLEKLKTLFKGQLPSSLYCPITGDIFQEPVMTSDGQTYQKRAIEHWLSDHNTSPLTGRALENKNLVQNFLIKKMINEFMEKVRE